MTERAGCLLMRRAFLIGCDDTILTLSSGLA